MPVQNADRVELATELTVAWLSNANTRVAIDDIPAFLASMYDAVGKLAEPAADPVDDAAAAEFTPAVSVRKSLANPNYIISLIDGRPYRALKRHLAAHGLTPAEYRQRYGLKADYPMVASAYSEARREVAKKLGLGRKPGQKVEKKAAAADKPATKKRRSAADAKAAAKAHLAGGGE